MSSHPSIETICDAEVSRTLSWHNERNQRDTDPITCAIVANTMLMDDKITIGHDFICPLSQMIPEDPVLFGGTVYERELAEGYIKDSMTKVLPRSQRIKRHVRDPLNPGRTIYTKPGDGSPITDNREMENVINDILFDVDSSWEANLKKEVDRARYNPRVPIRTNDGMSHLHVYIVFHIISYSFFSIIFYIII